MYITTYFVEVQTCQAERDVTNHKSRVNQTIEPLKLTSQTSGGLIEPILRTTDVDQEKLLYSGKLLAKDGDLVTTISKST